MDDALGDLKRPSKAAAEISRWFAQACVSVPTELRREAVILSLASILAMPGADAKDDAVAVDKAVVELRELTQTMGRVRDISGKGKV